MLLRYRGLLTSDAVGTVPAGSVLVAMWYVCDSPNAAGQYPDCLPGHSTPVTKSDHSASLNPTTKQSPAESGGSGGGASGGRGGAGGAGGGDGNASTVKLPGSVQPNCMPSSSRAAQLLHAIGSLCHWLCRYTCKREQMHHGSKCIMGQMHHGPGSASTSCVSPAGSAETS
eukprot:4667842-Prymnesium_polylepis.5